METASDSRRSPVLEGSTPSSRVSRTDVQFVGTGIERERDSQGVTQRDAVEKQRKTARGSQTTREPHAPE